MRMFCLAMSALTLCACSSDDASSADASHADAATQDAMAADAASDAKQVGIVSGWVSQSLAFVDIAALKDGATAEDATLHTMALSDYLPGPLNAEVTPDGKLALVSVSAGFFSIPGAGMLLLGSAVPTDPGTLLFVDVAKRKVLGELDTGSSPMGIAITHDGKRAFVAHFSTNNVTVVDIAKREVIEQVNVGPYSEEIVLDDSGEVGIFSYSAAGNIRTFATSDMAGTLSEPLVLTGDAAGVAFFPGTKTAYVVQAPNPITQAPGGHTVVDVRDPSAPVVLEDVRDDAAPVAYPAVAVPKRDSVVVPITVGGKLQLREIKLTEDDTTEITQTIDVGDALLFGAYGATVDAEGRVLLSVPREHYVAVVDLEAATAFIVPWGEDAAGPTDIALIP